MGACPTGHFGEASTFAFRSHFRSNGHVAQIKTDLPFDHMSQLFGPLAKGLRMGRLQQNLQTLDFSVSFQDHADQNVRIPRQMLATIEHAKI